MRRDALINIISLVIIFSSLWVLESLIQIIPWPIDSVTYSYLNSIGLKTTRLCINILSLVFISVAMHGYRTDEKILEHDILTKVEEWK